MSEPLTVHRRQHQEVWTIDLPAVGNAISGTPFIESLEQAVCRANADMTLRAVVLTGAGSIFSSGGNLAEILEGKGHDGQASLEQRQAFESGIQRIPRAMIRCEVPIIAAVNGPAIGAGCDLAMMCDLRIASTKASFAESFVQLGLIPGDGGTWFLPRAIGELRAAEMTLTGDRIDARRALEWGMVSTVVPPDELMVEAQNMADRVSKNPTHALRMAKRLLQESRTSSLDSSLRLAAAMQALVNGDPEHHRRLDLWRAKHG
ncbi:enoyl-CoA hydratase-related protein [Aeromicrobium sp. CTD01-1L150]|uniref:enoyl-CoA hydratase-related protein n=1 Tax=Aeromicrobium sp. CTD01-1L150 TaxID=3341830 RepID=UPI0035C0C97A